MRLKWVRSRGDTAKRSSPTFKFWMLKVGWASKAQSVELSVFQFSLIEIKKAPHLSNIRTYVMRAGFTKLSW